ncbi:MAG: hypothetical protein JXA15_04755 [Spirochaetales bacterium]|nr:hypothetical protein [Spirochaetales bacterium]
MGGQARRSGAAYLTGAIFIGARAEFPDFERFVDGLPCPDEPSRARSRLVGLELFDNLVSHASPLRGGMRVRFGSDAEGRMTLLFAFRSRRFRAWLRAPGPVLPSWSPGEKRWRGLGLIMVRNLSSRVEHRIGPSGDRIVVTF